jgi:hypothetical protein
MNILRIYIFRELSAFYYFVYIYIYIYIYIQHFLEQKLDHN